MALKRQEAAAQSVVREIIWQVGRKRVTPVIHIEPVLVSGAMVSKVTGHHKGYLTEHGIGKSAKIELIRSGLVIPKHCSTLKRSEQIDIPTHCPACESELVINGDFLECHSADCAGKAASKIGHWFSILGNADLFGPKTCDVLVEHGVTTLEQVYEQTADDFEAMGFGAGQSANLVVQLERSRTEEVEDYKLLGAFGIHDLGRGDSRKLLRHYRIADLEGITAEQIKAIDGFGQKTSDSISRQLAERWPTIGHMIGLGFNLIQTPLASEEVVVESVITGKNIVFTGKMEAGSRDDMKRKALELGAKPQGGVNTKTDILVAGANVGKVKLDAAQRHGVQILSEQEFWALVN